MIPLWAMEQGMQVDKFATMSKMKNLEVIIIVLREILVLYTLTLKYSKRSQMKVINNHY
jgi:hypothetical protein